MSNKKPLLAYFKVLKEQPAKDLLLEKKQDPQLTAESSTSSSTKNTLQKQTDVARAILSDKSNLSTPQHGLISIHLEEDFATLMDQCYTKKWRSERCCQYLMHHASHKKESLWKDKYMPGSIEGLFGHLPDLRYLLDWLNRLRTDTQQSYRANIILLVGKHGVGKSASVQVAAKQAGYSIFEINSTSKRSGKEISSKIGGMSDSHLVRFDQTDQKKRLFDQRETIVIRDRVKRPKMDITRHFKPLRPEKKQEAHKETKDQDDLARNTIVKSNYKATQSLILLEEVDVLFEEDKGFWQTLNGISYKSKRPIVMTCNDTSNIPCDQLQLQATLRFDVPSEDRLLPYLQLVCYFEGFRKVKARDLNYIAQLYEYDVRCILNTLQLWLNKDTQDNLFAHIMGFSDLLSEQNVRCFAGRLQGMSAKEELICKRFFFERTKCTPINTIEQADHLLGLYSFTDAYISLSDQRRHQIYDTDQYQHEKNDMQNHKMLYKIPTGLDHWCLEEAIERQIYISNNQWYDI